MTRCRIVLPAVMLSLVSGGLVDSNMIAAYEKSDSRQEGIEYLRYQLSHYGIDASTREGIEEALRHKEGLARALALSLLAETEGLDALPDIEPHLSDSTGVVWRAACEAIATICEGETGVNRVEYHQATYSLDHETRVQQASTVLRRYGISPTPQQAISRGLRHSNEAIRLASLDFLAAVGDAEHLAPVIELAKTSSGAIKDEVLRAISRIARSSAIDVAKSIFEEANYDDVRFDAAIALARLGDPSQYRLLYDALRDPNAPLFVMAIDHVAAFGDYHLVQDGVPVDWEAALGTIVSNFDVPPDLRQRALLMLNRINPERARTFISEALPLEQDSGTAAVMRTILDPYAEYPGGRPPQRPHDVSADTALQQVPSPEAPSGDPTTPEIAMETVTEETTADQAELAAVPAAATHQVESETAPESHWGSLERYSILAMLVLAATVGYLVFRKY